MSAEQSALVEFAEAQAVRAPRWRRTRGGPEVRGAQGSTARPWRGLYGALAACAVLLVCVAAKRAGGSVLSVECASVTDCERVAEQAAAEFSKCWWLCGERQAIHRESRVALVRARERQAERAHYQERNAADRREVSLREGRERESKERERAVAASLLRRQHEQRLELEKLRQDRMDRRLAQRREREQVYLRALGREGREARLRRCHRVGRNCELLVLGLVSAAPKTLEKQTLAILNEALLGGDLLQSDEELPVEGESLQAAKSVEPTPPGSALE